MAALLAQLRIIALVQIAVPPQPSVPPNEILVPTIEVKASRPDDQDSAPASDTASVTVINVRDAPPELGSVAEALARTVGIYLREIGGIGAPVAISVRGSTTAQVAVFLDGIPLARSSTGSADLSRLPTEAFDRIEVYRGAAPGEFGGQGIGGAINLVTRRPIGSSTTEAHITYGSFETRRVDLYRGARPGNWEYTLFLHYFGTEGDFPYYNDNATPFNRSDDDPNAKRRNNALNEATADLGATYHKNHGVTTLTEHVAVREQGVPSVASILSDTQSLNSWQSITYFKHDSRRLLGSAFDLGLRGDFTAEHETYRSTDRVAGADSTYKTATGGGSLRLDRPLASFGLVHFIPEFRFESFAQDNRLAPTMEASADRTTLGVTSGVDLSFAQDLVILEAQARLDAQSTSGLTGSQFTPNNGRIARDDVEPTFRIGSRLNVAHWIAFRGSFGRRFRSPTFYELFGDRGSFVGNPELLPETALAWDAGLVVDARSPTRWMSHLVAELTYFETRVDDLIVTIPAQRASTSTNVPGAINRGLEAAFVAKIPRPNVSIDTAYTFLRARDEQNGLVIPARPEHDLSVQALGELSVHRLGDTAIGLGYRFELTEGVFRDRPNQLPLPTRFRHDVRAFVRPRPFITVGIEIRNLFDQRTENILLQAPGTPAPAPVLAAVSDFGGYPLPGRAVYVTVDLKQ